MFGGANLQSANANSNNLFAGSYANNNADITVNTDTNPNPTDNSSTTNLFGTHNNISTAILPTIMWPINTMIWQYFQDISILICCNNILQINHYVK